ncbi:MAG: MFS transporter [Desulfurococcales archaeon]|nr:MFS transporter [Desulfurococcales archaeon]
MRGSLARLMASAMLWGLTWGLLWSVLAPYLKGLGYTGSEYGLVGATSVLSGALFTLLGGVLSDRYGARPTLAVGLALESAAMALVSTGSPSLVAAGFFVNGASNGLGLVAQQALTARIGSDRELHYTFSYVSAASTLGGGLGSFLGWAPVLASRHAGIPLLEAYRYSILLASILPLAAIAPLAGVEERLQARQRGGRARLRGILGRLGRGFYVAAGIDALIGFGAAMSVHNIDYYFAAKYGVTSAQLGSVLGAQQLAMALLMTRMPGLAERLGGALRVYILLASSSLPLLVAITLIDSFPLAAGLYLVRSILMNVANPLFTAFIMSLVPSEYRGTAAAFLSISWTVPAGIGRAVGGWLLDRDLELPLRLTAAIYAAALASLALAFRARQGEARKGRGREAIDHPGGLLPLVGPAEGPGHPSPPRRGGDRQEG